MVIAAGWEQERLIRLAKGKGHWVLATAWPAGYADSLELADVGEVVDNRELEAFHRLAEEHRIEAVTSDQCDYSMVAAAYVAERLGLPGPRVAAAQVANNKADQRRLLEGADVPQPRSIPCASLDEARAAVAETGYPAILKPVDNRGNFGVNRVDEDGQVSDAFFEALANAHSRRVLVEEFVEGTMTTVEGFAVPGQGHLSLVASSKEMLGGRKRVAMELAYPAELSDGVVTRLLETNQRAIAALGYDAGPTHAEYMVTAEGVPYFIEAANRGGGCLVHPLVVPAASGLDTTALQLDLVSGADVELPAVAPGGKPTLLRFFALEGQGVVEAIRGLEAARAVPGVLESRVMVAAGAKVAPITTDSGRHGFVIATADSLAEAREVAARAAACVEVDFR